MADDYIEPPPADDYSRITARLSGYDWGDINAFQQDPIDRALAEGYSQEEIDTFRGRGDPQQGLNNALAYRVSSDPQFASGLRKPEQPIPLTPMDEIPSYRIGQIAGRDDMPNPDPLAEYIEPPSAPEDFSQHARESYANALLRGDVTGGRDFAERYAGALWKADEDTDPGFLVRHSMELANSLPSDEDFTDQAIALAKSQNLEVTPEAVRTIKERVVDDWAENDRPLLDIYRQAQLDPEYAQDLTAPPPPQPNWLDKLGTGALDVYYGAQQRMANALPDSFKSTIDGVYDTMAAAGLPLPMTRPGDMDAIVRGRQAMLSEEGLDESWWRWGGEAAAVLPMFTTLGLSGGWGLLVAGATGGAIAAAFHPSTAEDYWTQSAKDILIGAEYGAGGGAIFHEFGRVIGPELLGMVQAGFNGIGRAIASMSPQGAAYLREVISRMEEPKVKVLDPGNEAGWVEMPASDALAPVEVAQRNFSGEMRTFHGGDESVTNWLPSNEVPEEMRYDGGGGVFGLHTYLAETPGWITGESMGGGLGRRIAHEVAATFDNAFVLTPETMGHLEKAAPDAFASGDGVKLTTELEKQGYDGLIVRGFDKLDEASGRAKAEAGRLLDEGKITGDEYNARLGAADRGSEYWNTIERARMNHEWAQDQVVAFKPEAQLETRRAAPVGEFKFAQDATPMAKMGALARDHELGMPPPAEALAANASRMADLSTQAREAGDEFYPGFFSRLAAGQDEPTKALAEGMDRATSIGGYLVDLGRDLLRDESGALTLFKTASQKQAAAEKRDARDFVQPLLVRGMGWVAKEMEQYGTKFDYYRLASGDVVNLHKLVNPHMPEWRDEIAKGPMGNPMNTVIGEAIRYIEGRSAGVTMKPDNPLGPVADAIREVNRSLRQHMEDAQAKGLHNLTSYYNDYFRHMWKDPNAADREFGVARQGKADSWQLRTLPTIEDGLNRGLAPKYENPIELTMYDAAEKLRYLGTLNLLDESRNTRSLLTNEPFAYWGMTRKNPTDVPLNGVGTTKDVAAPPTVGAQRNLVQARATRDALNAQIQALGGVNNAAPSLIAQRAAARAAVTAAEKAAKPQIISQRMWANPGFAKNWNDNIATGFFARDFTGKVFENMNYLKNLSTQTQLIGPFFHARTIGTETIAGGFANMASELISAGTLAVRGDLGRALQELGRAGADFVKTGSIGYRVYEQLMLGDLGLKIYQGRKTTTDPVLSEALGLLGSANARFGPRQELYKFSSAPSLMTSLRRGSLGEEWREQFRLLRGDVSQPVAALPWAGRLLKFAGHETGRFFNTTTGWLFDYTIPRLKDGVNIERMQTYLRRNPTATMEQKLTQARQIAGNTDDRMGEMNMDNIFWPKTAKQIAQLSMISPGWVYGSMRFFSNAIGMDIEKGRFVPFTNWNEAATTGLIGFTMAIGLVNSITHYLYNGELPQDWKDVALGPITGAVLKGVQQRVMAPSQAKELFDYGKIIATGIFEPWKIPAATKDFVLGKMPGIWQVMRGLLSGEDAVGHKISSLPGGYPAFIMKTLNPIIMQSGEQRKQGTGINEWDQFFGAKEVPRFAADPEGFYKALQFVHDKEQKEEHYRALAENKIYEQQREVPDLPESLARPSSPRSGGSNRSSGGGGGGGTRSRTQSAPDAYSASQLPPAFSAYGAVRASSTRASTTRSRAPSYRARPAATPRTLGRIPSLRKRK